MTIAYEIDVTGITGRDWTVDGDGEVCITVDDYSGWAGAGEQIICFDIADLEQVVAQAKRHHVAYQAYKEAGYEDEAYHVIAGDE